MSLCHLAEHLWLEYVDLTGCYRLTDDGLDVLTMACTGLQVRPVWPLNSPLDRPLYDPAPTCVWILQVRPI